MDNKLVPPLKWAGGKRWLVPYLRELWEPYNERRLVEPFCGGLAVALGLRPRDALLNDINPHLLNFYRWLQRGLVISQEFVNDKDFYYRARSRFNELIKTGGAGSREAAELFYYLNRTGYNGLCRFNKNGEFNVPFGRYRRINYVYDFRAYRSVLGKWEFQTGDFAGIGLGHEDFVYADPPYDVEFTQYAKGGFTWEDQVRLANWLAKHPGPVAASNQATERIIRLYAELGFELIILKAPRRISCTGDRSPAQEILALKNVAEKGAEPWWRKSTTENWESEQQA
ncbi:MAG: Dam family site-specific DNA-(adenine-N6)-methyltransferase [Bacillota bacterium]|jgi:DNA adenine methylase|nr:Dam family site-specific DNA-(adenine-N6)-methyltransferase [Bacillota bacterium]NLJ02574.1 Dam family site-specific DNA-(adenine-N6)-methyltransferase [Bacillota bacterium]